MLTVGLTAFSSELERTATLSRTLSAKLSVGGGDATPSELVQETRQIKVGREVNRLTLTCPAPPRRRYCPVIAIFKPRSVRTLAGYSMRRSLPFSPMLHTELRLISHATGRRHHPPPTLPVNCVMSNRSRRSVSTPFALERPTGASGVEKLAFTMRICPSTFGCDL